MKLLKLLPVTLLLTVVLACNSSAQKANETGKVKVDTTGTRAMAAFAEGCFWCSEHIFEDLEGVDSVVSGYAGGHTKNPTYEEVCTEKTGHAETVMIYYNPKVISYPQLLDVFFSSHDPTTLNRQGPDEGTSYRSAIFYLNNEQKGQATDAIKKWQPSFKNLIVTEVSPLKAFYRAEEYHQDYAKQNPYDSYIRNVSAPRFQSFKRECKLKFKKE